MEEFLKDLYKAECQRSRMYLTLNYILVALLIIFASVCCFLLYELSTYEQVEVTTETYTQDINGNIVNGNQYNDSATHNEGGIVDGKSETNEN